MTSLIPTVTIVDGTPRVSSLDIAEKFGKSHKDVLRTISRIMRDLDAEFTERNFAPSEYVDETGRTLPMYSLTRDAFSLVAMGFTGKEALAWKVKYIEAFNAMARELLGQDKPKRTRKDLGSSPTALPQTRPLRGDLSPIQERELQAIDARIRAANAYCWKECKEISSALLSFAAVNIGSIAVASLADAIFAAVEGRIRCTYITPDSRTEPTNMLRYFRKSLG